MPLELEGAGVRVLSLGTENGPLETLLIVHEEKDDAAPVVERVVEVSPGKFEVHVKRGSSPGRNTGVIIYGWDEEREFTVRR